MIDLTTVKELRALRASRHGQGTGVTVGRSTAL